MNVYDYVQLTKITGPSEPIPIIDSVERLIASIDETNAAQWEAICAIAKALGAACIELPDSAT